MLVFNKFKKENLPSSKQTFVLCGFGIVFYSCECYQCFLVLLVWSVGNAGDGFFFSLKQVVRVFIERLNVAGGVFLFVFLGAQVCEWRVLIVR